MDRQYKGMTLSSEAQGNIEAPNLREVMDAIDELTPDGGPSFLCLQGPGASYLQAAGGDGCYVVERRVYAGANFRHFIAGRHEGTADEWVRIPTNGASVKARPNEELRLPEVKVLVEVYLAGGSQAAGFVWRDMSDEFDT